MSSAILIIPKELTKKIDYSPLLPFMHFVAVIDGVQVHILKNRFGTEKEINISSLPKYLEFIMERIEFSQMFQHAFGKE